MLIFPTGCETPRRRVEFCFHAREKLRLFHNKMGHWYRPENPPITQGQYDNNLPSPTFDRFRARYPYSPKLSVEQWNDFQDQYEIIDNKINEALHTNLQLIADSSEWTPDLEEIHGGL